MDLYGQLLFSISHLVTFSWIYFSGGPQIFLGHCIRVVHEVVYKIDLWAEDGVLKIISEGRLASRIQLMIGLSLYLMLFMPLAMILGFPYCIYDFVEIFYTSLTMALYFRVIGFVYGIVGLLGDRASADPFLAGSENAWQFGQLLQMFLIALPLLTALEACVGEFTYDLRITR